MRRRVVGTVNSREVEARIGRRKGLLRSRQHETVFIRVSHGRGISRLQLAASHRAPAGRGATRRRSGRRSRRGIVGAAPPPRRASRRGSTGRCPVAVCDMIGVSRLATVYKYAARSTRPRRVTPATRTNAEGGASGPIKVSRVARTSKHSGGNSAFRHGPRARNSTPPLRSSRTFAQPPMKNALAAIEL